MQAFKLFSAVILSIAVAACQAPDRNNLDETGTLVRPLLGEPLNLIPQLATDQGSHNICELVYVAPLKYDGDLNLKPWAAETFQTLDGGRRFVCKLREDIRWTDGTPLTARDVEFTVNFMRDPETPTAYASDYLLIKKFTVTGPLSFEVEYDEPFARAPVTWAHAILPAHALGGQDPSATPLSRQPIGAGSYMVEEWIPGEKVILRANPDYFMGKADMDRVVFRVVPDLSTQFMELSSRSLDMMELTPQQDEFQTNGTFWEDNFRKYPFLSFSYTYLGFNHKSPFFSDVRVRRALAHAIDKQELVRGVLLGRGVSTIGPFKPGTWVYNEAVKDYSFDPDLARRLLDQAGWTDSDGDGIRDKDGRPFAFTLLTNQGNTMRVKTATIIQHRLAKVGVRAEVRTVEWAAFISQFVDKGRFDAVILGWNITQDPDIYDVWHSSRAGPGGLNFIGYQNAELDELLMIGRSTVDREIRRRAYFRVQEILHRDQPYCFLYVPMELPVVAAKVKGIHPQAAGIEYNFSQWRIEP